MRHQPLVLLHPPRAGRNEDTFPTGLGACEAGRRGCADSGRFDRPRWTWRGRVGSGLRVARIPVLTLLMVAMPTLLLAVGDGAICQHPCGQRWGHAGRTHEAAGYCSACSASGSHVRASAHTCMHTRARHWPKRGSSFLLLLPWPPPRIVTVNPSFRNAIPDGALCRVDVVKRWVRNAREGTRVQRKILRDLTRPTRGCGAAAQRHSSFRWGQPSRGHTAVALPPALETTTACGKNHSHNLRNQSNATKSM